jgi:hypothetical protein
MLTIALINFAFLMFIYSIYFNWGYSILYKVLIFLVCSTGSKSSSFFFIKSEDISLISLEIVLK